MRKVNGRDGEEERGLRKERSLKEIIWPEEREATGKPFRSWIKYELFPFCVT